MFYTVTFYTTKKLIFHPHIAFLTLTYSKNFELHFTKLIF